MNVHSTGETPTHRFSWAFYKWILLAFPQLTHTHPLSFLLTLLMLKWPSNLQPSPLLRGIFIELSIWPTSCLPISSWMSSPTTAWVGGEETKKSKEITGRLHRKSMHFFYWEKNPCLFPDIWLNCASNVICQILIVIPALQKELCNQTFQTACLTQIYLPYSASWLESQLHK